MPVNREPKSSCLTTAPSIFTVVESGVPEISIVCHPWLLVTPDAFHGEAVQYFSEWEGE